MVIMTDSDVLADAQEEAKQRNKQLITTEYTALPPALCNLVFQFDNEFSYINKIFFIDL